MKMSAGGLPSGGRGASQSCKYAAFLSPTQHYLLSFRERKRADNSKEFTLANDKPLPAVLYCRAVIKVVSTSWEKRYTHRDACKLSVLMLECNFEEIYPGMQLHNETERPPAKEAKGI